MKIEDVSSSPFRGRVGRGFDKLRGVFNRSELSTRRKDLRRNATLPERRLWFELKNKRVEGIKFRRQCSIGNYIADFFAPEIRLVIEIDGETHVGDIPEQHDKERTHYLSSLDIICLRFRNEDVRDHLDGVITIIREKVCELKSRKR